MANNSLEERASETPSSGMPPLLETRHLRLHFPQRRGIFLRPRNWVKAVDDISLTITRGETLGLVGESGSGKSTLARTILRLIPQQAGTILFDGVDISSFNARQMRPLRQQMRMIFQDPYGSLNPRMSIGDIVGEPLAIHDRTCRRRERLQRVAKILQQVGLPADCLSRYPHQFSGGQRQRIVIARTLILSPRLVIADEPVTALDVSIQAQIINLLQDMKQKLGLTYLFIAHDLGVVKHVSDRVAVIYLGKVVELATTATLYQRPQHPYTRLLLSSIPIPDPTRRLSRTIVPGDIPSALHPPAGCHFHPRCPFARPLCRKRPPQLREISPGNWVACHFAESIARDEGYPAGGDATPAGSSGGGTSDSETRIPSSGDISR